MNKCCDTCIYYNWYWDFCSKWKCEVDNRYVCNYWTNKKPKNSLVEK